MLRRDFLTLAAASPLACGAGSFDLVEFERDRILEGANRALREEPRTITAARCDRSAGGLHDFYSEGDYWWPDPANPSGPYVQRDGLTNPGNFVEHRRALMRLSVQVPALVAAWKITGDRRYEQHARAHLDAWFVTPATRMNPNLQYAQAIHGRTTGRGIGIIDTIHLVEVARAAEHLDAAKPIRQWFSEYTEWMMSHPNGKEERDAKNNHGTCFVMQIAAFARLTGDTKLLDWTRDRYRTVLLPNQMAADGSFPLELRRTKPYGYSLFNLDAMATLVQIVSTPTANRPPVAAPSDGATQQTRPGQASPFFASPKDNNLWTWELPDGRGMRLALAYMEPFIRDRKQWKLPPDVMYDSEWPRRQCALLFAGTALSRPEYVRLWSSLPGDSTVEEVIRNFFVRQPVLWIGPKGVV